MKNLLARLRGLRGAAKILLFRALAWLWPSRWRFVVVASRDEALCAWEMVRPAWSRTGIGPYIPVYWLPGDTFEVNITPMITVCGRQIEMRPQRGVHRFHVIFKLAEPACPSIG